MMKKELAIHYGGLLGGDNVPNQTRYWVALLVWDPSANLHTQETAHVVLETTAEDNHVFRVESDPDSQTPQAVLEAAQKKAFRLFAAAYREAEAETAALEALR